MLEDIDMYVGLETPSSGEVWVCRCSMCMYPATMSQYLDRMCCVSGHVLRIAIRDGNIDTAFRDVVLAELYRSFISTKSSYYACEELNHNLLVTVGVGLACAQARGFAVRDPRVAATSPDAPEVDDDVEAAGYVCSRPLKVCPAWLDPANCMLDIPTLAQGIFSRGASGSPSVILCPTDRLQGFIDTGRVKTGFGFAHTFEGVHFVPKSVPCHTCLASMYSKSRAYDDRMNFNPAGNHVPETLVVHYARNGHESVDTITLYCDGEDEPHVLACPDVLVDDATGNSDVVCVFDLHGMFVAPAALSIKHHPSFLCSLLVCGEVAPEL